MSSGMDMQTLMQSLGSSPGMNGGTMGENRLAQHQMPDGSMMDGPMMEEPMMNEPMMEEPMMEEPMMDEKPDAIKMLIDALTLVRQATDVEDDPQMSLQLEQISSMIQKALASDHADTLNSMGMKPGMNRILAKAAG